MFWSVDQKLDLLLMGRKRSRKGRHPLGAIQAAACRPGQPAHSPVVGSFKAALSHTRVACHRYAIVAGKGYQTKSSKYYNGK
jgi:hypothetical protein